MVLVLSRGGYCAKDRRQAEGLVELYRELQVAYCRLVTISTDNITQTNEYRSGVGAHWPFLSDAARTIQKNLDIAEYTDQINNPMIPYVIVLEPGLIVYKIYNGYWVLGTFHARGSSPRPARGYEEMPAGLGHYNAGDESRMAAGAQAPLLAIRQDVHSNAWRSGLKHHL